MSDYLKGQFLVASPSLHDPNFLRSVVLMCEHNEHGALGLVINRPTEIPVGDVLPQLDEARGGTQPLRHGGPVQPGTVFILHDDPAVGGDSVAEGVYFGADEEVFSRLVDRSADDSRPDYRIFTGYAGWSEGQLEFELSQDSWILCPATRDALFKAGAMEAWSELLREMGGPYALLADAPIDPELN